ncbi:hypothetical protein SAMN05421837_101549 [Amycolatopsis pretoriensis]|uniref:Uncharacterized protein n=1 Tax=Amycolatopsis pretoriensis TaxID=218821 RepID=A0A1H5Q3U5_9PSEU|nr:hypothetical protein [Amycolatopsis pretoriensis]SEF20802.1 hypothetical protein SAMN05421837_101549 [Amycolatopsis pretoriensis]
MTTPVRLVEITGGSGDETVAFVVLSWNVSPGRPASSGRTRSTGEIDHGEIVLRLGL